MRRPRTEETGRDPEVHAASPANGELRAHSGRAENRGASDGPILRFQADIVAEALLTDEMARDLWNETAPYFGATIVRTLMRVRAPDRFRYDAAFHAEVIQYVATQYWSAVRRGKLSASTTGGWLVCVTARATSRLLWPRVREGRRHVELTDQIKAPSADDATVEEARDRRLELEVLNEILDTLPELHRRILLSDADSENGYKKLAFDTGVSPGALRTRKHRLVKRLRSAFNKRLLARRRR